jgi:hypothetical protein
MTTVSSFSVMVIRRATVIRVQSDNAAEVASGSSRLAALAVLLDSRSVLPRCFEQPIQ